MEPFFIHNYRVMGSTIINFMPQDWKDKFYQRMTFQEYETKYNLTLNQEAKSEILYQNRNTEDTDIISFDHLTLDQLLDLGILTQEDIPRLDCLCLIREPIERFLSYCNHKKIIPNLLVDDLMEDNYSENLHQNYFFLQKHPWKITLICDTDYKNIKKWFQKYDIEIDLTLKKNQSKVFFKENDMMITEIDFLKKYFQEDYFYYNQMKKQSKL